jgi:hypothetical protein
MLPGIRNLSYNRAVFRRETGLPGFAGVFSAVEVNSNFCRRAFSVPGWKR